MSDASVHVWEELAADQPMPAVVRRRIIGEHAMLARVLLHDGCVVPTHAHENEQFACVMSGRVRFTVGEPGAERTHEVGAGAVLYLPANVPHSAEALVESIVLDVFSPPSETTGVDVSS